MSIIDPTVPGGIGGGGGNVVNVNDPPQTGQTYGPFNSGVRASNVVDDVLDLLAESRTAPVFWTRAELLQYLNDGFIEFQLTAGMLISEDVFPLVSSKIQAVPLTAIALIHVAYVNVVAEKTTVEGLDRNDPNWEAKYGTFRKWAPCGLDKWFVDRHPTSQIYANLTTLDIPVTLEEDTFIDLAPEFIEVLIDYAYHMARFKEGGAEFGQAMAQYDQFQNKAGVQEQRTYVDNFVLWSRDPAAKTGEDYAR